MARSFGKILAAAFLLALVIAVQGVGAVTEEEIQESIDKGVVWLASQQNADGSWTLDGPQLRVLQTSLAVIKLTDYAREQRMDPFSESYPYKQKIINGLNFIFGKVRTELPDVGAIWDYPAYTPPKSPYVMGQDPGPVPIILETSAAMTAIANTGTPGAITPGGTTYLQVVQDAVQYVKNAQMMDTGGWGPFYQDPWYPKGEACVEFTPYYTEDVCLYDPFPPSQLDSGFAALALQYANKKFDINIDDFKPGLKTWIPKIQCMNMEECPVCKDPEACDFPCLDPDGCPENIGGATLLISDGVVKPSYTGFLLIEQRVAGFGPADDGVPSAVQYLVNHWADSENNKRPNYQWKEYWQTLYLVTSGLVAMRTEEIPGSGSSGDWFDEFATKVMSKQSDSDGSWPLDAYWALLTLEGKLPNPEMTVLKTASEDRVSPGETVTYTYTAENIMKSPIYDLSLSDDKLGTITGPESGDGNNNRILDPGEKWLYQATSQPLQLETTNIATMSGTDLWGWEVKDQSYEVTVTVDSMIEPEGIFIDVKPRSCPNAFNLDDKGVLPVAILGTATFDVNMINPATIVAVNPDNPDITLKPLRTSYENVATPYIPADPNEVCGCHEDGVDGYLDLTLKFKHEEIVDYLKPVDPNDPDNRYYTLTIRGTLLDGTTEFEGSDCVWFVSEKNHGG